MSSAATLIMSGLCHDRHPLRAITASPVAALVGVSSAREERLALLGKFCWNFNVYRKHARAASRRILYARSALELTFSTLRTVFRQALASGQPRCPKPPVEPPAVYAHVSAISREDRVAATLMVTKVASWTAIYAVLPCFCNAASCHRRHRLATLSVSTAPHQ